MDDADAEKRFLIRLRPDRACGALWRDAEVREYASGRGFSTIECEWSASFDWFVTSAGEVLGVRVVADLLGVLPPELFSRFPYVEDDTRLDRGLLNVEIHFRDGDCDYGRSAHGDICSGVALFVHESGDVLLSLEYSAFSDGCPERLAVAMEREGRLVER